MPPPAVTVARPVTYPVQLYHEFSGYLESVETVQIRARAKGILTEVKFDEGDGIAAGTDLYTIDPREYESAVKRAEADITRANADIEKAEADITRAEVPYKAATADEARIRLAGAELDTAVAAAKKVAEANRTYVYATGEREKTADGKTEKESFVRKKSVSILPGPPAWRMPPAGTNEAVSALANPKSPAGGPPDPPPRSVVAVVKGLDPTGVAVVGLHKSQPGMAVAPDAWDFRAPAPSTRGPTRTAPRSPVSSSTGRPSRTALRSPPCCSAGWRCTACPSSGIRPSPRRRSSSPRLTPARAPRWSPTPSPRPSSSR